MGITCPSVVTGSTFDNMDGERGNPHDFLRACACEAATIAGTVSRRSALVGYREPATRVVDRCNGVEHRAVGRV